MEKIRTAITDLVIKFKLKFFPAERRVYLVTDGLYKGEWLVQISKIINHTVLFSLPDKHERIIPDKDMQWGIANKVIIPVDVLPKRVHNVCIAEYEHFKHTHPTDRRKQHAPSRSLDRKKYKDSLDELTRDRDRKLVHLFKDSKVQRNDIQDE